MPRGATRTNQEPSFAALGGIAAIATFAQQLGESLGQGIARGLSSGLTNSVHLPGAFLQPRRGPGRPPKAVFSGPVPADRRCKVDGCANEARSKGLCSKHYQAERRRILAKA